MQKFCSFDLNVSYKSKWNYCFFKVCREFLKSCSLLTNADIPVKFLTNILLHFFQDLKISGPAWVLQNNSLLRVKNKFVLSNLHFIFENFSDQS